MRASRWLCLCVGLASTAHCTSGASAPTLADSADAAVEAGIVDFDDDRRLTPAQWSTHVALYRGAHAIVARGCDAEPISADFGVLPTLACRPVSDFATRPV